MLARNFRTSKSKSILVILTNISNLFYMEIVHGISEYANEQGYDILLSETQRAYWISRSNAWNKVKNRIADGAVFLESTIHNDALLSLEKELSGCTMLHLQPGSPRCPMWSSIIKESGYMAAKALIAAGHKKLAFVGTNDKSLYNRERRGGLFKSGSWWRNHGKRYYGIKCSSEFWGRPWGRRQDCRGKSGRRIFCFGYAGR